MMKLASCLAAALAIGLIVACCATATPAPAILWDSETPVC